MSVRQSRMVRRRAVDSLEGGRRSDAELVDCVGHGRPAALEELYRRHAPLLFAVARRAGGARVAESALSTLFLQIWASPESFTPVAGSLRQVLLTRMLSVAATEPPSPTDRVWALLTVGRCTFAEAARLLAIPEADVREHALAAFRARLADDAGHTRP